MAECQFDILTFPPEGGKCLQSLVVVSKLDNNFCFHTLEGLRRGTVGDKVPSHTTGASNAKQRLNNPAAANLMAPAAQI